MVDDFGTGHGGAVRKANHDLITVAAGNFGKILQTDSNNGAVFGFEYASAAIDVFPEGL